MRFRTGLAVGLGLGYYLGSRAGHDRYQQIEQWLDRVRATATYRDARTRVTEGILDGGGSARRLIGDLAETGAWQGVRPTAEAAFGDPSLN